MIGFIYCILKFELWHLIFIFDSSMELTVNAHWKRYVWLAAICTYCKHNCANLFITHGLYCIACLPCQAKLKYLINRQYSKTYCDQQLNQEVVFPAKYCHIADRAFYLSFFFLSCSIQNSLTASTLSWQSNIIFSGCIFFTPNSQVQKNINKFTEAIYEID